MNAGVWNNRLNVEVKNILRIKTHDVNGTK